jgi:ketosteroid isomerase-like protein
MTIFRSLTLVWLSVISGIAAASQPISKQELNQFNDRFNQVTDQRDLNGFLDLYSKQVLWIAPDVPPVEGHGEPTSTFQFISQMDGHLSHTVDQLFIAKDGSQAVMIGTAIVKVEKAGMDLTGTYLFVIERQNGDLKIVTDMWHQHANKMPIKE